METWKQIPGHRQYIVSSCGRVKRIDGHKKHLKEREVKPSFVPVKGKQYPNGYLKVTLLTFDFINDIGEVVDMPRISAQVYSVHRLVAMAFIPNPDNKPEINHKDGNKLNNHVSNLEWVTKSENIQHSYNNLNREVKRGSEHWRYGKKASEETKRLQSESKKGRNHPKFKGFYIVHHLKYESCYDAAVKTGENQKTIWRKCMKGEQNSEYYFVPVNK